MTPAKPTIAQVLHRLYLAGAEVLAADLSRRLKGRYNFVFLCLDEVGPLGEQLRSEGFPVVDLQRKPGVDLSVARRIRAACREHSINLLHAHQYTPFFYAAASRRLTSRPPVLFTEHGRHYPDYRRPKRVLANKFLLRRRDRVTAVGNFSKKALVDNEGIPDRRVQVIYNGIDAQKFMDTSPRAAVRKELGIADDQLVILQIARFHPVKDHATAVRAVAQIPADLRPLLVLVGNGEKRAETESLARELNIADRVRFLGVRSDIARITSAGDAFTLSSLSEGISVTLLEAMAAGLPIAATDVGGNPEVVIHNQTGLLSPRSDPNALAQNLTTLLRDPALRRRMGDAGRQRLLTQFTQQEMHSQYAKIYDQMLAP